jgi:hypothetical protein
MNWYHTFSCLVTFSIYSLVSFSKYLIYLGHDLPTKV